MIPITFSVVEVTQAAPGEAVARFLGDHDLTCSTDTDVLLTELIEANQLVTVDLSDATFIDSSFLHSLVKVHHNARARETRFRVRVGNGTAAAHILRLTGLIHAFDIVETEDPAAQPLPEHFTQAISA